MPRKPHNTIAEKRARIFRRLSAAQAEMAALQAECEHTFATKINRGNSGYDYEHYWRECRCDDCGKFWTEEQ